MTASDSWFGLFGLDRVELPPNRFFDSIGGQPTHSTDMDKHKILVGALLFCLAAVVVAALLRREKSAPFRSVLAGLPAGRVSPLKAKIKISQTSVKDNEILSVSTTLTNSGSKVWVLGVWACGFSNNWSSDNPAIQVNEESCLNNAQLKKVLKPGEAYERLVPVRVNLHSGNGQPQLVTFRLGFKDPTIVAALKTFPIWSNAVTVSVTR